jgi:hypothetical protein
VAQQCRIAVGVPARILEKPVPEAYKTQWSEFKKVYVDLARRYPDELQDLEE